MTKSVNTTKQMSQLVNYKKAAFLLLQQDTRMGLLASSIFIQTCIFEGLSNVELAEMFEVTTTRVSVQVHILCDVAKSRDSEKGLSLCRQEVDSKDFRIKRIYLTEKGKKLKAKLFELLGE